MKKLLNKKNNKGFSLVELIVVVLIMGIIAVALAPQVMKWVGTSKEKTDDSNKAALKSSVQMALADWQVDHPLPASGTDATFTVDSAGAFTEGSNATAWAGLKDKIDEVTAEDYPKPQAASSFTIKVSGGTGKVEVN